MFFHGCGSSCHDVPYPLQSSVWILASCLPEPTDLDPVGF
jgi:hypothetical protein